MVIHGRIARVLLSSFALTLPFLANAQSKDQATLEPEFIPGQYLVRLKQPHLMQSTMGLQKLEKSLRGKILRVNDSLNFMLVQKPVVQTNEYQMQDLKQDASVALVEPNYIYRANKTPNDPDLGKLWGLVNSGQADSENQMGLSGVDIGAEKAWDITTGSDKVLVAVIDTGLDYTHPDLAENSWVNEAELNGQPGVDDDGNGIIDDIHGANFATPSRPTGDPMDDHGHGSHCAGTIGAKGDDGKGIVGVNWNVKIMGAKFLGRDGSGSLEGAIMAIDYSTKMGARILSNSWAGGSYSKLLEEAIQRSRDANALFVAAASNNGADNDASPVYPATYHVDNIVSVAAVDNRGELADFSNYGKTTVHIAAPGVNIYSSIPGATHDSWSGTSMATPHVSGVAALLFSNDETLSAADVKARLLASARPLAALRNKMTTGGVVNAYYALTGITPPADPNDPMLWTHMPLAISSLHPYARKTLAEFEVSVPGATQFAIHFAKFEVERGYDFVRYYDRDGNLLTSMTGNKNDDFSPVFSGDYVRLVLETDDSVEKYGFDIDGVYYK